MRVFVALLLLVFTACGPNPTGESSGEVTASEDALLGRWELIEARRNNVRTETLGKLYLDFGPDERFETNLLTNTAQVGTYSRSAEELEVRGVEMPLTYEVVALEGDVLTLRSRIEGYLFEFLLQRATPPPAQDEAHAPET